MSRRRKWREIMSGVRQTDHAPVAPPPRPVPPVTQWRAAPVREPEIDVCHLDLSGTVHIPVIVLEAVVFLKYVFMANQRDSRFEVGGYGLNTYDSEKQEIRVSEFILPKQEISEAYNNPDAGDLSDIIVQRFVRKDPTFQMNRVTAVWMHTHPKGIGNTPSPTDWSTLDAQSSMDWTVMLIMDGRKDIGAHIRHRTMFGNVVSKATVKVDWSTLNESTVDFAAWQAEYDTKVSLIQPKQYVLEDDDSPYGRRLQHCAEARRTYTQAPHAVQPATYDPDETQRHLDEFELEGWRPQYYGG